jgi:hypothetical protein
MKLTLNHTIYCIAKQGSFMPSYWSAIESNDRTPGKGSMEDRVA